MKFDCEETENYYYEIANKYNLYPVWDKDVEKLLEIAKGFPPKNKIGN